MARVEEIERGGYALGIFIDRTRFEVITDTMSSRGLSDTIVDWTKHMLESRIITTAYGDASIESQLLQGCPQGEILSPLLWCFVVDDLLQELRNEGFLTYGYADDVVIIVRGKFLSVYWKDGVAGRSCP